MFLFPFLFFSFSFIYITYFYLDVHYAFLPDKTEQFSEITNSTFKVFNKSISVKLFFKKSFL